MREAGHLSALIRSLRAVLAALSLSEASDWAMGLRNVATVLLESVASFVSSKAGNEAEQNSKTLVQSAGLVEMVCLEVLPYPQFDQLRLQATETLAAAIRAVPEASLGCFKAMLQGRSLLDRMVAILLGEGSAPLDLRAAIEVLVATGLERSADVREVLATQPETAQGEMPSGGLLLLAAFRTADQRLEVGPLQTLQNVWWPSDANTWFAARALGTCIRSGPQLRLRLARPPDAEAPQPALLATLLGPTAALARAWRNEPKAKQGGDASAGLCALLQLLAEWCHDCPAAAEVLVSSPALLPELMALLESFSSTTSHVPHVYGLAALVLGTCLLELPNQGSLVTSSQLMEIIASKGVDMFTRASEDFLRSLSLDEPGMMSRYRPGFQEWVALQFQKVQDAMVQLWLQRGESAPHQGMAEDVAGHFKDLIKMQDKELRDLRQEVQKLKTENDELRQLTTDEDKTILLWKVGALSKQCEALQVKCDLLEAARSAVEVARLRERQSQRQQREELEQQLQTLALALDEAEISKETQDPRTGDDGAESYAAVVAERDELLTVLSQINRSCPEVAGFLAPLGRFVPSTTTKEVSAWEAAAERVGQQAEALSELAESHKRSLVELQERAASRQKEVSEVAAANGWHASQNAGGQSHQGVQSHTESLQQKQSQDFSRQAQQQNQLQSRQSNQQAAAQQKQSHQQAAAQQAQQQSHWQAQQSQLQAQQSDQQAAAQQAHQQSHWQAQQSQLQAQQSHWQAQQSQLQAKQSDQQAAIRQAQQQSHWQAQQSQLPAQQSDQQAAAQQVQQQGQCQAQQSDQQAAAQQAQQQSHWQAQQSQLQAQQSHWQAQQSQLQAQQSDQQAAAQQAQQSHWQAQQSQLQAQQSHWQAQQSQLQAQQSDQQAAAQQAQQSHWQAQQSQLQAQQGHQQAAQQVQQQSQLQGQQNDQQAAAQQAQQSHWQAQQSHLQAQQGHQQAAQQAQQQSQLQVQQNDQQAAAQQGQQSHEHEQNHVEQQNGWNQLPTGWVAYSTAEGHVFYYNQSTGQSQWERPG
ncbi:unnamed protein product [Cladocopium goreaui]|uniref:WW domain-containing protein n=1 Tax=Cladocopium goreaui TaxID=2562237 RepID=A0A9P1BXA0_9DINO|nr:unnamed protein product [Cladocopium goreaui]